MGVGGNRLTPNEMPSIDAIEGSGSTDVFAEEPPPAVLSSMNPLQRNAFIRQWNRVLARLRAIHFDFEESLWMEQDIDSLGSLLCKYAHRFSKYSADLGHVAVDPFRIIHKKCAQPVKQRPYRHSPVLAAKVQTEIDRLVLAGILRRPNSNWTSPLVVVAKADGRIRLTCN